MDERDFPFAKVIHSNQFSFQNSDGLTQGVVIELYKTISKSRATLKFVYLENTFIDDVEEIMTTSSTFLDPEQIKHILESLMNLDPTNLLLFEDPTYDTIVETECMEEDKNTLVILKNNGNFCFRFGDITSFINLLQDLLTHM